FFFQAEDGIRDGHVTGVQTCALPICRMVGQPVSEAAIDKVLDARPEYMYAAYAVIESEYGGLDRYLQRFSGLDNAGLQGLRDARSEERRVGKECRSRGLQ